MTDATTPLPDIPAAQRPLVVQSDASLMLEVDGPWYPLARDALAGFAQLEKSPEHIHTYRLTPLSLWNGAAVGLTVSGVLRVLDALARYAVPEVVRALVTEQMGRYGRVRLTPLRPGVLLLSADDPAILRRVAGDARVAELVKAGSGGYEVDADNRGLLKQAMVQMAYPVEDLCGYVNGTPLSMELRATTGRGEPFGLRDYQAAAVQTFHQGGGPRGGAGVVVLPCGAGKTVVGMGVMAKVGAATLVLTTSTVAVHQWMRELADKTNLPEDSVGEYTGLCKQVKPVTVATYQMLTHRESRNAGFPHLELLSHNGWGLIIYDEVHMLPAPVFRATAGLQARRRLGLTATLVREDGLEEDVFALIGPKRFEVPWKVLEGRGFIAEAICTEVRVALPLDQRVTYALADKREKFRIASVNPAKVNLVEELIAEHHREPTLVIGQYLDQLKVIARDLSLPLITGETSQAERERLYTAFRHGQERVLVVSKVANFAIDLPDASVAIQVSGTFGSRQEEAQRLGRILRPKDRPARFYTLVSQDTTEQEFARKRQLFLVEQGYHYEIVSAEA